MSENISKTYEQAIAIPLDLWKNPTGRTVLEHNDAETHVYFDCWDLNSHKVSYFGKLSFGTVIALRSLLGTPLRCEVQSHSLNSFFLEVVDSNWKKETLPAILAQHAFLDESDFDQFHHYIVPGKNNFIEVLATEFTLSRINFSDAQDLKGVLQAISF
jgi:hypothetical protein